MKRVTATKQIYVNLDPEGYAYFKDRCEAMDISQTHAVLESLIHAGMLPRRIQKVRLVANGTIGRMLPKVEANKGTVRR